jgi:hypothetical protein
MAIDRAALRKGFVAKAKEAGRAQATPEAFLKQTFTREKNCPSPGLGMFDAVYVPASGELRITTKVHVLGVDPRQSHLAKAMGSLVPKYWDQQFVLRCRRPGWEAVEVRPRFEVRFTSAAAAHFVVTIQDEEATDHFKEGPIARVTQTPHDYGNLDATPPTPARHALFGAQAGLVGEVAAYRRFILRAFKGPTKAGTMNWMVKIPIEDPTRPSPGASAQASMLLREMKALLASQSAGKKLELEVRVVGRTGLQPASQWGRAQVTRAGLSNPVKLITEVDASAEVTTVAFCLDRDALEAAFPKKTGAPSGWLRRKRPTFFSQPTVVHEFGHLLGLPDEYICLSDRARDAMQAVTFFSDKEMASVGLHGTKKAPTVTWKKVDAENQRIPRGDPRWHGYFAGQRHHHVATHQKRFVTLCQQAAVPPPRFGTPAASIMSAGTVFHVCHGVTLWECLTRMTRMYLDPGEWSLELAS